MADERTSWISRRAYDLWERAGRPHGRDEEHWLQAAAEREMMERTRASHDGAEILARNGRVVATADQKESRHTTSVAGDEPLLGFDAIDTPANAEFSTFEAAQNADEAPVSLNGTA